MDADVAGKRIPPGADAADDAIGGEVVQGEERGSQQADIAGPVVDDARADLDAGRDRGVGSHGDDGVTHPAGLGLPDGLEAALLSVAGVVEPITQVVRILQIECYSFHALNSSFLVGVNTNAFPSTRSLDKS